MTTDQRGENSQLQDIQGKEGSQELFWYTSKIQGIADHLEQRTKVVRHCVNMYGVT